MASRSRWKEVSDAGCKEVDREEGVGEGKDRREEVDPQGCAREEGDPEGCAREEGGRPQGGAREEVDPEGCAREEGGRPQGCASQEVDGEEEVASARRAGRGVFRPPSARPALLCSPDFPLRTLSIRPMARAEIGASHATATAEPTVTSNVLVVLVSRDGRGWLRRCLASLARQTYERLGVVAVDNDSTDGSAELLEASLGADRVVRLAENRGFPGAVAEALRLPAASKADHVLLLHDDTLLAPEAISRLVEASRGMDGGGVVGPKILDAEDPKVLSEIGLSADRFGYPFSPLEKDEIDQGQYDRVREVLYVSSAAMLVSREVFERIGGLDERFVARQEDLDFCWRARLAGFRVLWTPRAVALHHGATVRGERVDTG